MFTPEDEKELEQQADEASLILLLLLFRGERRNRQKHTVDFDRQRGVFVLDGRRVSQATMQKLLQKAEQIGKRRAKEHTTALIAGRIDINEWHRRMSSTIKASHLIAAGLALGGINQARADKNLAARINSELSYLDGYRQDIINNRVSDAKKQSRSSSYFLAILVTFSWLEQILKTGLQKLVTDNNERRIVPFYTEARRYRRAKESCNGCRRFSGQWMPIRKMPPLGSLECGSHCRCFIVYR
jgi:hypothetical protein